MQIILILHAERERYWEDRYTPLTTRGVLAAEAAGQALRANGITPHVYFTSWFLHARLTAERLRQVIGNFAAPVQELCSLTPTFPGEADWINKPPENPIPSWVGQPILGWIVSEAAKTGHSFRKDTQAVLVAHYPRFVQLLKGMTDPINPPGVSRRPNFSGVGVIAPTLNEFLEGKGTIEFHIPLPR